MRRILLLLPLLLLLAGTFASPVQAAIPVLDGTFHIVPDAHDLDPSCPEGAPLSFGAVLDTAQKVVNAGIAFGVLICVIIMAWAGFLFIISVANPEARSKARGMLSNAAIGLLIVLSAWLMVDFVMRILYSGEAGTEGKWGPWNSILGDGPVCIIGADTRTLFSGTIVVTQPTSPSTPTGTPPSGPMQSRICQAANAYKGTSTVAGPSNGRLACAWAVNNVLNYAGVRPIGTSNVAQMESLLKGGRGTLTAQKAAGCGDIVIEAGKSHVGICLNAGCTQVLSNSSSRASFVWVSDITFKPSYTGGTGRIYRVTN